LELHPDRTIGLKGCNFTLTKGTIQKACIKGVPHPFMKYLYKMNGSLIPFREGFSCFVFSE
jgi:hypothetical protein